VFLLLFPKLRFIVLLLTSAFQDVQELGLYRLSPQGINFPPDHPVSATARPAPGVLPTFSPVKIGSVTVKHFFNVAPYV